MQYFVRYFAATLTALALVHLSIGPSLATEEASWAAVKETVVHRAADGTTYIAFSSEALSRAAKRVKSKSISSTSQTSVATYDATAGTDLSADEVRTVSQWVKPHGKAQLYIQDVNSSLTNDDNLQVTLIVPSGAVSKGVTITMTVYGNYLSDLVIAFQPGGLVFDESATLKVGIGGALVDVDPEGLTVWHEYEDGTVEEATLTGTKTWNNLMWFEFNAEVPGFSRYGLRD